MSPPVAFICACMSSDGVRARDARHQISAAIIPAHTAASCIKNVISQTMVMLMGQFDTWSATCSSDHGQPSGRRNV